VSTEERPQVEWVDDRTMRVVAPADFTPEMAAELYAGMRAWWEEEFLPSLASRPSERD